jgi:SAM-dependent methyltransferase
MSTPHGSSENQGNSDNTYVIDSESAAELARLMRQDHLLTTGMGGLFPERANLDGIHQILDIACGPGGWVLETAFQNPGKDVYGGDISQKMIAYAQGQAKIQGLSNAIFRYSMPSSLWNLTTNPLIWSIPDSLWHSCYLASGPFSSKNACVFCVQVALCA